MDAVSEPHLTRKVFVAGDHPSITYNPRKKRHQESEIQSYLNQKGKALSISGPTKSGKTVLVERFLPSDKAIWMQGSELSTVESFWETIVDWLGLYNELESTHQESSNTSGSINGTAQLPGIGSIGGSRGSQGTNTSSIKNGRKRSIPSVARDGLKQRPVPIVLDDFHYVPDKTKREIARTIKSLIPMTHVIMIAVPYDAFQAVRQEPDMTGRVWNLKIEPWSIDELKYIATSGFHALGIQDEHERHGTYLAECSYGAPFLMQQLCFELCIDLEIEETQASPYKLDISSDFWKELFQRTARRTSPPIFEKLLSGPKTRGQPRIHRPFKDGNKVDIYGAILLAVAKIGSKESITYQEIRKVLAQELESNMPQPQQVVSTLTQMSNIANKARGSGDPAVAYKDDKLYLLDPFLEFYIRWGAEFDNGF